VTSFAAKIVSAVKNHKFGIAVLNSEISIFLTFLGTYFTDVKSDLLSGITLTLGVLELSPDVTLLTFTSNSKAALSVVLKSGIALSLFKIIFLVAFTLGVTLLLLSVGY
jgi:hypothetical protein